MHILYVHKNFPAQFGHVAARLVHDRGYQCTFVTNLPGGDVSGIRRIHYEPRGGAKASTHYMARSFENAIAHSHGVYEACKAAGELKPDLIVAHSGFGSTLFLRELYDCPIINYFEYFYHAHGSDLDFRPQFPPREQDVLRSYARNAMILLDLDNCDTGYCPTHYQRSLFPDNFADKLQVIFDGIDTDLWSPKANQPRVIQGRAIDQDTRIVTYVSRGFEAMRGFDIFMQVAKRIYREEPNTIFVVVGEERTAYGGDEKHISASSFLKHVLARDEYDLSKFAFTGRLPPRQLAEILAMGNLHLYLTVPFVLSWSLFNALSCGCTVVASNTPPVRELIEHETTGLLADFHDVDTFTKYALRVLRDPSEHRHMGETGRRLICEKYTVEQSISRMLQLYERVISTARK